MEFDPHQGECSLCADRGPARDAELDILAAAEQSGTVSRAEARRCTATTVWHRPHGQRLVWSWLLLVVPEGVCCT